MRRGREAVTTGWTGFRRIGSVLVMLMALTGWGPVREIHAQSAHEVTVSAAISLKNAFEEIGRTLQGRNRGIRVLFNFGASGDLARQIEAGAPVDIFASAGSKDMDDLDRKGLIAHASRIDFARNSVVLVTPVTSSVRVDSLKNLPRWDVKRIAIGNPKTVPAGRYAEEALRHFNLWDALRDRLIFAENVRQVLDYVARNEADAGLVYSTDAMVRANDVKVVERLPEGSHQPAVYPIAIIKATKEASGARAFVDAVISPEGQKILGQYGFITIHSPK